MAKASQGSRNNTNAKNFERRIAELWSKWTGVDFRRRKIEGHDRKTVINDGTADVICVDQSMICRFCIECKKRKDFSFTATPFADTAQFWDWFTQVACDTQLRSHHDPQNRVYLPIVHFKPTPNHDFVAFYTADIVPLLVEPIIPGYHIIPSFTKNITRKLIIDETPVTFEVNPNGVQLSTWADFKRCVDPKLVFHV